VSARSARAGVSMPHPRVFWLGIGAITFGVIAHLPMFFDAADMHYKLYGMGISRGMIAGMVAIGIGLVLAVIGLLHRRPPDAAHIPSVDVSVEEGKISMAHASLLIVLSIAVVIDAMKASTFPFIVPGAAAEYGLKSPAHPHASVPVALYPLVGAGGMALGALLWGHFGDRLGRRAGILLSGVIFIATSICGAMPYFSLNLVMCTLMGIGVGGMIPTTFALLAETIPTRHRSFAMVMVGAAVASAFALTSALASWLIPIYSWRIMWLIGLPTGLLLIASNRWIPESPRFLVSMGRKDEAEAVLRRFGSRLQLRPAAAAATHAIEGGWRQIVSREYAGLTLAVCLVGFSAGLLTFGFQLWAPSTLPGLGVAKNHVDALLRNAGFIAIPVTAVIAPAYGYWSSKRTIVIVATLVTAALVILAFGGDQVASSRLLLYALVALPIAGASSLIMIVAAYSSEVYPTEIRARGGGAATSAGRIGGVLIILSVVFSIVTPSMTTMSIAGAVALILSVAALVPNAIETRQRSLETITREELDAAPAVRSAT
jgi:putative MFS transporter